MRLGLVAPDATTGNSYVENPAADALYREACVLTLFWRVLTAFLNFN
jgi:hypothetical protein